MSIVRAVACLVLFLQADAVLCRSQAAEAGVAETSGRVEQLLSEGEAALGADDLEAAEAAFTSALDLGAGVRGHCGLGKVYSAALGQERAAERSFQQALKLDPECGDARYHLALLYATWRAKKAVRAFEEVLRLDPGHGDAAYQIGCFYQKRKDPHEALAWFEKQLRTTPGHALARVEAGRVLMSLGEREAGLAHLEQAVKAAGPVGGPAHLALACARLDEGAFREAHGLFRAYLESLSEQQQEAFHDPAFHASKEDLELLERHDTASGDLRRRFWVGLDPTPLTEANEQPLEHYRRVAFALEHYPKGDHGMDRRGEVYVRYGPPDHASRWDDIRIERSRDIQDIRIEFINRSRIGFAAPPGRPIFPVSGTSRWEYWIYGGVDGGIEITFVKEFEGRGYDYAPMPGGVSLQVGTELTKLDPGLVMRDAIRRSPSLYRADFADLTLDFHYDTAGFRGEGGRDRLEVYYGLPAREVARLNVSADSDLILLDRGVVLFDSLWTEVHRVVDSLAFRAPTDLQIQRDAFIPGVLSVDLAPGLYRMALQVRDAVSGKSQVYREEIRVEDYQAQGALMMSDVALAFSVTETDGDDEYTKHGLRVVPMPSRAFRADQSAFIYFEIYNLTRDEFGQTRYRVAYEIQSQTKRSAPARILHGLGRVLNLAEDDRQVSIAYEQSGNKPDEIVYVELDLSESNEGDQTTRIKVTDLVADRSVDRSARFRVVPSR